MAEEEKNLRSTQPVTLTRSQSHASTLVSQFLSKKFELDFFITASASATIIINYYYIFWFVPFPAHAVCLLLIT